MLTLVFLESVYQYTHTIIPELYTTIVQRRGEQRLGRVERQAWSHAG